jgi:hypothetical protein
MTVGNEYPVGDSGGRVAILKIRLIVAWSGGGSETVSHTCLSCCCSSSVLLAAPPNAPNPRKVTICEFRALAIALKMRKVHRPW